MNEHEHQFVPAGSAVTPNALLVFGLCHCGFAIASQPYIVGHSEIEEKIEPQQDKIMRPFGKGARA